MTTRTERQAAFRTTIERFLKERLDAKLDKLPADDPKRPELIAQHARETWLADAARRGRRMNGARCRAGTNFAMRSQRSSP